MYSPRRVSSKYRSSQYYKKKRINRKFSPALYKSPIPTYFQQKGRIIQTSPARIPIVPRFLPNRETLDDMYNTLIKANYPNVGPSPSFQYDGFYFTSYSADFNSVFPYNPSSSLTSDVIDSNWLKDYVTNYVQRPPLPEGFEIHAEIFALNFDISSGYDASLYNLVWWSPLKNEFINIVHKEDTSSLSTSFNNLSVILSPHTTSQLDYNAITISSSVVYQTITTVNLDQTVSIELQYYPFVTSDDPPLSSYLQIRRYASSPAPPGNICFYILFKYVESL